MSFDPFSRPLVPQRGFEDLAVGERFPLPARTITEAHFAAFQLLSGDNHPIHYDRSYCEKQGHRDLLAHGLHVFALTAAGAGLFPHVIGESLIGFIEASAQFKKAIYPGDTLYPLLEITEQRTTGLVRMRATIENQDAALVLEGTHVYLLRLAQGKT